MSPGDLLKCCGRHKLTVLTQHMPSIIPACEGTASCLGLHLLTTNHGPIPPALDFLLAGRGGARWRIRHLHCFLTKIYNYGESMQLIHKVNLSTGLQVCLTLIRLLQPFSFPLQMCCHSIAHSPFLGCSRPGRGYEQIKAIFCLLPPHSVSQSFLKLSYNAPDLKIRTHT